MEPMDLLELRRGKRVWLKPLRNTIEGLVAATVASYPFFVDTDRYVYATIDPGEDLRAERPRQVAWPVSLLAERFSDLSEANVSEKLQAVDRAPLRKSSDLISIGCMTAEDMRDFNDAERRIEAFMMDGHWYYASEIILESGQREGLRRLRALRRKYIIERARSQERNKDGSQSREWMYRLVSKPVQD